MTNKSTNNNRGYSIIEMLVVVGLMGILLLGASNTLMSLLGGSRKASLYAEIKNQGDSSLLSMERLIRDGKSCEPVTGSDEIIIAYPNTPPAPPRPNATLTFASNKITLNGSDLAGNSTIQVNTIPLASSVFQCIKGADAAHDPDQVVIQFRLSGSVTGATNVTENFYHKITLRNLAN